MTKNYLINGDMNFFQRQAPGTATSRSDNQYGPDRWKILVDTDSVNCQRGSGRAAKYCAFLTANGSARRFGIVQALEARDTYALRELLNINNYFARAMVKTSGNATIHIFVLEWTGTEDAPTMDAVNDWTSTNYTPGNFFKTGFNVLASNSAINMTSWTGLAAVNVMPSASGKNLLLFIFTDPPTTGTSLYVTEAQLAPSNANYEVDPTPVGEDFARCQRYFYKTYEADTAPGSATAYAGRVGMVAPYNVAANAAAYVGIFEPWPVALRTGAPSMITLYDAVTGAAGAISVNNEGATRGGASFDYYGSLCASRLHLDTSSAQTITGGQSVYWHVAVEADF